MSFFILLFCFSLSLPAQTLNDFLKLSDEEKIFFLTDRSELIDKEEELNTFTSTNPSNYKLMLKVGKDLSNLWYDTILEGPYLLQGNPEVRLTGLHQFNHQIYAISGILTAPAIFTDDIECQYNEESESYTGCYETTIYQNFYMDISGNYIESENYPEVD